MTIESKQTKKTASSKEKSPVVDSGGGVTYQSLRSEVEKPYRDRRELGVGRSGRAVKPRKYHFTPQEKRELTAAAEQLGRKEINPFMKRVGLYYAQVESLIQLGADDWHSAKAVFNKTREILESIKNEKTGETAWDKACGRKSKENAAKPKSIHGKVETNFEVLQRLPKNGKAERNPYGAKLAQFGMAVDIEYRKIEMPGISSADLPPVAHYRLNTKTWNEWDPTEGDCPVVPMRSNPYTKRGRKPKKASEKASVQKAAAKGGVSVESDQEGSVAAGIGPVKKSETVSQPTSDEIESEMDESSAVESSDADLVNEKKEESGDEEWVEADADEGKQLPGDALHNDFDDGEFEA